MNLLNIGKINIQMKLNNFDVLTENLKLLYLQRGVIKTKYFDAIYNKVISK